MVTQSQVKKANKVVADGEAKLQRIQEEINAKHVEMQEVINEMEKVAPILAEDAFNSLKEYERTPSNGPAQAKQDKLENEKEALKKLQKLVESGDGEVVDLLTRILEKPEVVADVEEEVEETETETEETEE